MAMMMGVFGLMIGMVVTMLAGIFSLIGGGLDVFGLSQSTVALGVPIGIGIMVLGVFWLVTGIRFLKPRRSAWKSSITSTVLSIMFVAACAVLGLTWFAIALVFLVPLLFYLNRGSVKQFFLSAPTTGSLFAPRASANLESLVERTETESVRKCQNCGAMVPAGATVCSYCGAPA